jgi:hypothetical protein
MRRRGRGRSIRLSSGEPPTQAKRSSRFDIEADYRRYVGGSSLNCYRNSSASTCTSAIAVIRSSWRLRVMRSPYVDMTTALCRSSWDATTRCMNSPAAARVSSSSAERRCQPSCTATVGTAPLPTAAPGQRIGSSSPREAVTHLSHSIVQQTFTLCYISLARSGGECSPPSVPRRCATRLPCPVSGGPFLGPSGGTVYAAPRPGHRRRRRSRALVSARPASSVPVGVLQCPVLPRRPGLVLLTFISVCFSKRERKDAGVYWVTPRVMATTPFAPESQARAPRSGMRSRLQWATLSSEW